MSTALTLELRPSRRLLIFLLGSHLLAAIAVPLAALPLALILLFQVGILASLFYSLYRHWWHAPRRLRKTDSGWWLMDRYGECPIQWRGQALITPWLMVLPYHGNRRGALVLPGDTADPDALRRLRVKLLYPDTESVMNDGL